MNAKGICSYIYFTDEMIRKQMKIQIQNFEIQTGLQLQSFHPLILEVNFRNIWGQEM